MRHHFLAFIILLICFSFFLDAANELQYSSDFVDPTTGITQTEILKEALLRNPDIQTANRRILEAKALRGQAGVFYNPELEISAGSSSILGESGDHDWGAAISQTFELGGKRSKRIHIADLAIKIAEQELREKERQVRWELQQIFAETLATAATIQTTQEALMLNEKSHEITLARVQQGETATIEKSISEVELNRLRADLAMLKMEGSRAITKLKTLTGFTQAMKIHPIESPSMSDPPNMENLLSLAFSSRPDYKLAILQTDFSQAEIALAKAEGISDLNAFVEFSNERSTFDQFGIDSAGNPVPLVDQGENLAAGISIQLPFFNRNQGNTQAARARADATEIRKSAAEALIRQEVPLALERVKLAKSNYLLFRDSIMEQSQKQLSVLQASYRAGEFRFIDLLIEQKRALEIRKSYINSAKELLNAQAELEFVVAANVTGEDQ